MARRSCARPPSHREGENLYPQTAVLRARVVAGLVEVAGYLQHVALTEHARTKVGPVLRQLESEFLDRARRVGSGCQPSLLVAAEHIGCSCRVDCRERREIGLGADQPES